MFGRSQRTSPRGMREMCGFWRALHSFLICFVSEGMSLESLRLVISSNSGLNEYSQSQSFTDLATSSKHLESRSRFEQVFLTSPRARELYSSVVTTPQKYVTSGKSFDDYVKMAEEYRNRKSSNNNSSIDSFLFNESVTSAKPNAVAGVANGKPFEVSPFKPAVDELTVKKKIVEALSRLEDDNDETCGKELKSAKDTKRNFLSNGSKSGSGRCAYDLNPLGEQTTKHLSSNPAVEPVEGVGFSSESDTDGGDIDVVTTEDDDNAAEQIGSCDSHNVHGEKDVVSGDDNVPANISKTKARHGNKSTNDKDVVCEDDIVGDNERTENEASRDVDNSGPSDKAKNTVNKSRDKSNEHRLNISNNLHGGKKASKVNTLKLWSIKAVKNRTHMGIIVEGQRSEDLCGEIWHSTAIVLRIDARHVQTKSGSQYELIGPINEKLTLQHGFSRKFVKSFRNGFPVNWLFLVADHFNSLSSSESEDEKQSDKHSANNKVNKSRKVKHSTVAVTPSESQYKRKGNSTVLQTPENSQLPKEVEMKTTRSGRTVKPPLAWWRGQRIVTDGHHNVEIDPGREEHTSRSSMYSAEFQKPIKIEISSPERGRQEMSNSKGKERRSSLRIKISDTGKTQTKQDSSEEPDASREAKNNNVHKEESRENMKQVITSPVKYNDMRKGSKRRKKNRIVLSYNMRASYKSISSAKSDAAMQEEEKKNPKSAITVMKSPKQKMNHSLQSPNKKSLQSRENRPRKTGERNPQCDITMVENADVINDFGTAVAGEKQLSSSPSQSAKDGRVINSSKQSPAWKVYRINEKRPVCASKSPQEVNTNKELANMKISLRNSPKNSSHRKEQQKEGENRKSFPTSGSVTVKPLSTSEVANKSSCSTEALKPFEFRDNGSSITSDDEIDSLKKRLFFSPRRSANKTNTQGLLEDNKSENGHQEQQEERKRSLRSWAGKNDNVQKHNLRKNALENKALKNVSFTKKTAEHLVREETNHTQKNTKRSTRASACVDSESDTAVGVEMAPASKVPSPPKRVLRHSKKKPQKKSEALNGKVFSKEQAFNLSKQVGNKRNRKENGTSEVDERSWSEEEIQRLNEALFTIPGNTPMFWQKISTKVATRSAEQCQWKHQGKEIPSNKTLLAPKRVSAKEIKNPGSKVSSQQNGRTVTGGVGTIKRKRGIRELLERQDLNYEDDVFDSTPFKRMKDLKLPFNLSVGSESDDEEDMEDEQREHGTSYKTPGSRTPSSRFRPLGPLPSSTTPSWELVSPSLLQPVNRKDMDHYIYKIQQRKRGKQAPVKETAKQIRTSTPKKPSSSHSFPVPMGSEIFEARPTSDSDSDESEKDHYFSDE